MGYAQITENKILNISDLGLKVGDNVIVYCVGAGGGGGGLYNSPSYQGGDAGYYNPSGTLGGNKAISFKGGFGAGGGGGYFSSISMRSHPGGLGDIEVGIFTLEEQEIPVTIGERGVGGINVSGSNGGSTSFGSYLTANGGKGGNTTYGTYVSNNRSMSIDYPCKYQPFYGYLAPGIMGRVVGGTEANLSADARDMNDEHSGAGVVWIYW